MGCAGISAHSPLPTRRWFLRARVRPLLPPARLASAVVSAALPTFRLGVIFGSCFPRSQFRATTRCMTLVSCPGFDLSAPFLPRLWGLFSRRLSCGVGQPSRSRISFCLSRPCFFRGFLLRCGVCPWSHLLPLNFFGRLLRSIAVLLRPAAPLSLASRFCPSLNC